MPGRICRTVDEAFQAGWNESCDHGTDPGECPQCSLTDGEIARLVILLSPMATREPPIQAAA
ncbi:hypothetical protein ACFOOM_12530 [Streptomyces echinoruber]|jgi:hypothetical protein|uniref:Uncharacterized protein n=1 Tax=Streptomyces echinoruber TaxID=68898 RepID=A0A918RJ78_9ACTN|nr:hypothetical protein [Streptomyces echinoruber]GHA00933.1 hypothetical protein GCM10010389_45280 [Streptomyces echinoruber]